MNGYSIRIEIQDGKVKEILDRLNAAQETIYRLCILLLSTPCWRSSPVPNRLPQLI